MMRSKEFSNVFGAAMAKQPHLPETPDRAQPPDAAPAYVVGYRRPPAHDTDTLYSLGGVFDAPIFVFYRNAESITAQFRGKRLSIGTPGTR